ncbi:voltage-gated ion channel superfamily [Plasmopara halstedii]|uniref:Voltage-gated ion channel superfamily n=1 Tax=Plasmopara halstedii TaxID=4781 RepID=A0A0P1APJ3_PLAHL|nr:voltage-gated ion channel superfamily [Plasmopara halstedii]CEG43464.1 voltage-gated ion channel superfamily [Plasmopara halstedii]|eukprot:XP_024579833.1 voltage-gated ion channel superfamily [Plasmopara halstedii]
MPLYAAIRPTFNTQDESADMFANSGFNAESMIKGTGSGTIKNATTLGRFEKIFVFMVDPTSSRGASLYSFLIACAAFTSCFVLFLQTLDGPNHKSTEPEYPKLPNEIGYYDADLVFTLIFTPELLIRLIIWPSLWREHKYLTERRLKPFLRDFFNWFDVAAILPFYIDLVFGKEKSFVIMRLCRLLRIFKLARNHSGTYILLRAIRASVAPISVALIFFTEIVLFFSVVMYMVDPSYDRSIPGFSDLLTTGYFVVVTVATIGYGDITPTKGNVASRCFAVMIIMSGTLFLSMPLAIIGTEFDRAWKQHAESVKKFQQLQAGAHVATPVNINLAAATDDNRAHQKHEILVKYNAPNKLYLRLAAIVGEASLITQALVTEATSPEFNWRHLRDIMEDLKQTTELCILKCEELSVMVRDMIVAESQDVVAPPTWQEWARITILEPDSSFLARSISRWVKFCLIFSMIIVVFQTMPDLQTYGEQTFLCERKVKQYCENVQDLEIGGNDPGCFSVDNPKVRLQFGCSDTEKVVDSSCYGYPGNFGSSTVDDRLSCNGSDKVLLNKLALNGSHRTQLEFILPFRPDKNLQKLDRRLSVCKKWECDNRHVTFFEFGNAYVAMEYIFTLTYLFEFAAALFVCEEYRTYFKNPLVFIEMVSFAPFFVLEGRRFVYGVTPIYVIPPASQDFLTFLRLLRLSRIFKIQQSIPVTKVLWESISKTSARLTIPYFMLMVVTTILSFIMFELEKGQECFYGQECIVGEHNMTFPAELEGSVLGKRFLVTFKGELSNFDDFFSAFWFVIVTLATVGYGDMEPVTSSGKLVAVVAMIFGACYTAMPLTLVGSQFNKSYLEYKRREALLKTKQEVGKPYVVKASELQRWEDFARNQSFPQMLQVLRDQLAPLLTSIEKSEVDIIDDANKAEIITCANELKRIIYIERLQVMQISIIVNYLRKEGIRLAEQQVLALQNVVS